MRVFGENYKCTVSTLGAVIVLAIQSDAVENYDEAIINLWSALMGLCGRWIRDQYWCARRSHRR